MTNNLNKTLVEKLKIANQSVKEEEHTFETEVNVRNFIAFTNEYSNTLGESELTEALKKQGLNEYEISQIISFKDQKHITESAVKFFNNINIEALNVESPLSNNSNWLVKNTLKKEDLSEEYGDLIVYITQELSPKDKAEFLAILDRYISVTAQKPFGLEMINKFKNFNPNDSDDVALLVKEVNNFARRYNIDNKLNVKTVEGKEGYILYREGNSVRFNSGGKNETDCVYEEANGDLGLICVTSSKSTNKQQQLYKYRQALMKEFKVNVIPHIYCDSILTFKQEKNSKGASKFSADENISNLSSEIINSFNLIGAMLVFTKYSEDDSDLIVSSIRESKIQLFNDNAGIKLKDLGSLEKVKLLDECINNVALEMKKNPDFWIDNSNSFSVQKQILLNICSAYSWLNYQGATFSEDTGKNLKDVLSKVNLPSTVNLTSEQELILNSTKEKFGLLPKKLNFS